MKQIAVSKIPYGEIFCVFGDTFVALDRVDGGVLAIRRDIWKNAPFDKDGKNNLKESSINKELCEYLRNLMKNGADASSVIKTTVDLKATDSAREYGFFRMWAALLTLEQYGKYQHIISNTGDWWWLATPWRTPAEKGDCSDYTWHVLPNGYIGINDCSDSCGIRPALVFAPSLLVEYDDGVEESDDTTENDSYKSYLDYVFVWFYENDESKIGESPLSYEAWKAKNGEQVPGLTEDAEE